MKTFLKRSARFLFNVIRNLSLLFTLFIFGNAFLMYWSDEYREDWLQRSCSEINALDEELDAMEMSYGQEAAEPMDQYEVPAGKRTYYISLEETAYFENNMGNTYAVTIDEDTLYNLNSSITDIWEAIPEEEKEPFFKTRRHIINGKHVRYTFSENIGRNGSQNYIYHVVMKMGDTLDIPKKKFPDFKNHMKALNLPLQ